MDKPLKDLNQKELEELVVSLDEKKFHGRQIFAGLYKRTLTSIDQMTDLPLRLREKLSPYGNLDLVTPIRSQQAPDHTEKVLFRLRDNEHIESVRIPESSHSTLCLSTQVGCPLDCTFCATGQLPFKRNLSPGEIMDQIVYFARQNAEPPLRNLVFMGMGEPLLNYDNLVKAIRMISSENGLALSPRRMTVSTAGVVPGIQRLADENLKIKLAVSLNAPIDELRSRLMPINRKYPLRKLFDAIVDFQHKNGFRIAFEYALMPGVNDTPDMIVKLRDWLRLVPCKLNLIPINPIGTDKKETADWDAIFDRFYQVFARERITLTLRRSRGSEIRAACGQLAAQQV